MTTPCHQNIRSCNSKTKGVAEKYTKSAWIVHLDWTKRNSSYKLDNNSHEIVIANIGQTLADPFSPQNNKYCQGTAFDPKNPEQKSYYDISHIISFLYLFLLYVEGERT